MTDTTWPQALADTLLGWARQQHPELGEPIAAALTRCVGQLEAERAAGHVCVALSAVDAARLRASGLVEDDPAQPQGRPLVIDAHHQLYLHRDFGHEQALATRVAALWQAPPRDIPPEPLRTLFPPNGTLDWQALAVAQALRQRLTVISGGPGTGKTSTVLRLLACVLAVEPAARIQLAAPTGKAAQRLLESLQQGLTRLPAALQAGLAQALPREALTLHRLLGASPRGVQHHAGAPLAVDWLVVDEASMLDLALARQLLDALPDTGRLVLLGDRHQLAAVENGAVLAELCDTPAWTPATREALATALGQPSLPLPQEGPLPDLTVLFTHSHRFAGDSGIGRLAAAVREGDADTAMALLHTPPQDLRLLPAAALEATLEAGLRPYAEALAALWRAPRWDPAAVGAVEAAEALEALEALETLETQVWQAWDGFRLLCAGHAGPWGTQALNRKAAHALRRLLPLDAPQRLGEPLLITRNHAETGWVNGDILLLLPGAEGRLQACLRRGARTERLPISRLPDDVDGAFALTVHKAQGSEFDRALLLLPEGLEWVTREWVYTGLTRARSHLSLMSTEPALRAALAQRCERRSGLLRAVQAAAQSPHPFPDGTLN